MNGRIALFALCLLLPLQPIAASTGLAAKKPAVNIAFMNDKSKGMTRAFTVTTTGVDGKIILNLWNLRRGVNVSPGTHHFILKGMFGRGFYRSLGVAQVEVTGSVQPGVQYRAMGKVEGELMSLWIEETKSGTPISNAGSQKYYLCFPHIKEPC